MQPKFRSNFIASSELVNIATQMTLGVPLFTFPSYLFLNFNLRERR